MTLLLLMLAAQLSTDQLQARFLAGKRAAQDLIRFAQLTEPLPSDPINTSVSRYVAGRHHLLVADALAKRLAEIDPANGTYYQDNYKAFAERWKAAIANWERQAAPLRGMNIVVHHKAFVYLENWLGLQEVATLEPKPGVEPTSAHLSEVLAQLQRQPARAVIRSTYNDSRGSEWLSERAKIPAVLLPATVGGSDRAKDLFGFFDDTIQRLLAVLK